MPLWLLLLGAGIVVVAATGKSHVVDEAAITAVTKHALLVEIDVSILRKLQDLLSHAGRFELATLVKAKADGIESGKIVTIASAVQAMPIQGGANPISLGISMGGGAQQQQGAQPPPQGALATMGGAMRLMR